MNTIYSNYDLEHQSEICYRNVIHSNSKRIDVFTYDKGAAFYIYNNVRIHHEINHQLVKYYKSPYYQVNTINGSKISIYILDGTPRICGSAADEMYLLEAEKSIPNDWSALAPMFTPYGKTKSYLMFTNKVDPLQYPDYKIIENDKPNQ